MENNFAIDNPGKFHNNNLMLENDMYLELEYDIHIYNLELKTKLLIKPWHIATLYILMKRDKVHIKRIMFSLIILTSLLACEKHGKLYQT